MRSRQQGGVTGQNTLLLGLGEVERSPDQEREVKEVGHERDRLTPMMNKILHAQRMLTEHLALKRMAPQMDLPVLHWLTVKPTMRLGGGHVARRMPE